jgi:hypothetical protein
MNRSSRIPGFWLRLVTARCSLFAQSLWPFSEAASTNFPINAVQLLVPSGPFTSTEEWTTGLSALDAAIRSDDLSTSTVDELAEASVVEPTVGLAHDSSTALAPRSARRPVGAALHPH